MLLLIVFLTQCLFINSEILRQLTGKQPSQKGEQEKRFHLKWISDQTQFPFSFQLPHYDKELIDYDWYKYDKDTYVTKLDNYRPNYFVSKQPYKTKLTLFNYDFHTHDQLTTYEPRRIFDFNDSDKPTHRDLFTLLLLQSHRIRIDRDKDYANVTCLADFLIDQSSMDDSSIDLLHKIKDLALFNINLNTELHNYMEKPLKQPWSKNHILNYKKANRIGYGKQAQQAWKHSTGTIKLARRRPNRKQRSLFYYDSSDLNSNFYDYETEYISNKMFYKIRLGVGPIRIDAPFEQSLISCDLDLINADDVNLDHRSRVYKYLFKEDIGIDKDDLDKEYDEGLVIVAELSENYENKNEQTETTTESTSTTTTTITTSAFDESTVLNDNSSSTAASIARFIPRYIDKNDEESNEDNNNNNDENTTTESTTTEKSFVEDEETKERIKRPTLLFLLDNPNKSSIADTIQFNSSFLIILTFFNLFFSI